MQRNIIPPDLPYKIIEKELELEHNCDITLVNDLVNMYRQIIEAYESAQDQKFIDFQTRLHRILMRKDVQEMLRKQTRIDKRNREEVEMKRQNFRSRKTASMEADQDKITRKLSRIVENRITADKGTVGKAVNDINSQNTNLNERLEMRRRQSSLCSSRSFILLSN